MKGLKAERLFKDETQVMVATEAAGEGINLQFCHFMINYDIPWNPNRLEQRMGRITDTNRKKMYISSMLLRRILGKGKSMASILDKLDEIRHAIGTDKVFDVIGDVFQGKDFTNG